MSLNANQLDNLHRLVHDIPPTFEFCNSSGCNIPDTAEYRAAFSAYQRNYLRQIESEGGQPGEPLVGHLPTLDSLRVSSVSPAVSRVVSSVSPAVSRVAPVVRKPVRVPARVASKSALVSDVVRFVPSSDVLSTLSDSELGLFYKFPDKSSVLSTMRSWLIVMNKNEELERLGQAPLADNFTIRNSSGCHIRLSDIPMKQYVVEKLLACDVPGTRSFPLISGARL